MLPKNFKEWLADSAESSGSFVFLWLIATGIIFSGTLVSLDLLTQNAPSELEKLLQKKHVFSYTIIITLIFSVLAAVFLYIRKDEFKTLNTIIGGVVIIIPFACCFSIHILFSLSQTIVQSSITEDSIYATQMDIQMIRNALPDNVRSEVDRQLQEIIDSGTVPTMEDLRNMLQLYLPRADVEAIIDARIEAFMIAATETAINENCYITPKPENRNVAVRSSPTTSSNERAYIFRDMRVSVQGHNGGDLNKNLWWLVDFNGIEGWVFSGVVNSNNISVCINKPRIPGILP